MPELKTKVNETSVDVFLNTVEDEKKRADCYKIIKLMQGVTKCKPKMWGTAIIGFGSYQYKYDSGHEGTMATVSFSPRKANLALYLMGAIQCKPELLQKLGKHKTGKGCLYIKTMDDVSTDVLKELVETSIDFLRNRPGMKVIEPA